MKQLVAADVRVPLVVLLVCVASFAFGQAEPPGSRTVYYGSVLNMSPAASAAESQAREAVILDLTLFSDGFAYGKLVLPRRGLVVAGGGSLRNDSDLRLMFRDELPGMYGDWPAEFAHQPPGSASSTPLPGVVATFSGYRDFSFGAEGTVINGALAFSSDPNRVLNLELRRRAQYATWEVAQGRIYASFTAPYWLSDDQRVNEFLETKGRGKVDDFVAEGRRFDAGGMLGWGWSHEEHITLEGAARSYLSLLSHTYVYTGGAHPNTYFNSYLLEVRPSGITQLQIDDLFRTDSNWVKRLSPMILEQLAEQGAEWVTDGYVSELTSKDLSSFTLSADGLTFYFAPYAMGPYVQGTFEAKLPFDVLLGLAPAGGPLEAFGAGVPARW